MIDASLLNSLMHFLRLVSQEKLHQLVSIGEVNGCLDKLQQACQKIVKNNQLIEQEAILFHSTLALIDELVRDLPRQAGSTWYQYSFSYQYLGTHRAGEDFYRDLENCCSLVNSDVGAQLFFYRLCLCLGFKGRYLNQPKQLLALRQQLDKRIASAGSQAKCFMPEQPLPMQALMSKRFYPLTLPRIALINTILIGGFYALLFTMNAIRQVGGYLHG